MRTFWHRLRSNTPVSLRSRLITGAGAVAILVGTAVLLGWLFDVPRLKGLAPGLATMKANSALAFVLAGVSLRTYQGPAPRRHRFGLACAVLLTLLAALTLLQYLANVDLGVDELLVRDDPNSVGVSAPGRMAIATAILFLTLGLALLLLHLRIAPLVIQALCAVSILYTMLPLLGYVYGVSSLYAVPPFASVALHTVGTFLLLHVATLLAGPDVGLVRLLTCTGIDGAMTRRLIPLAALLPLFFGWLRLRGQQAGWYGTEFGLALFTLSNISIFVTLICWNAALLYRAEAHRRLADDHLRASEERFRLAIEAAGMGTWDVNLVTNQAIWSEPRFLRDVDEPTPDWQAALDQWHNRIHPDDVARVDAAMQQAREDRSLYAPEHRICKPGTDEIVWLKPFGRFLYDAAGQPVRFVGVFFDNSATKRTEEALQRSERLYRAIGESIDYGVWVCEADGKNTYASPSFLRLVGLTQEQCGEFGWGSVLHPEDADRTIAAWKECVRTRGKWDREHRFLGTDGRWHPILARGVPVEDEQGRLDCWVGINLDISRLKSTEEALRASERRFRELVECLPQLVWTCLPDGRCDYLSRQWVEYTGIPEADQLGYGWADALHPEDRRFALERWEHSAASGTRLDVEFRIRGSDGTYRWFKTRAVPFRDDQGRIVKWFGTNTDSDDQKRSEQVLQQEIAQRLQAEADLRRAHDELEDKVRRRTEELTELNARLQSSVEEKEVLLREVHHRVKNNLQVISSLLSLQAHQVTDASVRPLFQESQNRVRSMALVHERLYHSRDLAKVNFADYLRNLAGHLFRTYRVDHAKVKLELDADEVHLHIDSAVPCGLVVNELVTNCLKYAFPEGRSGVVRIRLHRVGSDVHLHVGDDGVGLPGEVDWQQPQTFGLRLIADLVDQLHGSLHVEAAGGTGVRILFPASRQHLAQGALRC